MTEIVLFDFWNLFHSLFSLTVYASLRIHTFTYTPKYLRQLPIFYKDMFLSIYIAIALKGFGHSPSLHPPWIAWTSSLKSPSNFAQLLTLFIVLIQIFLVTTTIVVRKHHDPRNLERKGSVWITLLYHYSPLREVWTVTGGMSWGRGHEWVLLTAPTHGDFLSLLSFFFY